MSVLLAVVSFTNVENLNEIIDEEISSITSIPYLCIYQPARITKVFVCIGRYATDVTHICTSEYHFEELAVDTALNVYFAP